MKKNKGFTLIELMVTIVILAIIAGMAAPSMMNIIQKKQLNDKAYELINLLVEKRSEAILKVSNQEVSLDASKTNGWKVGESIKWASGQPVELELVYTPMGLLESDSSKCFILQHTKDSNLKAVIIARKTGMVIYEKTLLTCPNLTD